ncbi:nitrous oxide-stimulated promoter family protein [Photobacterium ganghwense]|uniref:Nitrous oxide-stimulated promoter n=1 Tax=Photobacterium ganghwense TaxID=320778 RepID=A0A0J1H4Z6_9GAMM|nr:nitrous oxide-stimulated promoter family protein [Photobacterium ganghwense]KLV06839.1 nitrous oxide-stimulated promoter [Photobacterium ganghwense]PSU10628.1 nitrous oxide-stimulated promoter family protein [Photobacterium ganghwense]
MTNQAPSPVPSPVLLGSLDTELKTIQAMVKIYCRDHHGPTLCDSCRDFLHYAHTRLDRCPYGENKPTCRICPIHCYKADYKALSRTIMRYSGPRMLLRHPILAIRHLIAEKRPVPEKPQDKASNRHKRKALEAENTRNQKPETRNQKPETRKDNHTQ